MGVHCPRLDNDRTAGLQARATAMTVNAIIIPDGHTEAFNEGAKNHCDSLSLADCLVIYFKN